MTTETANPFAAIEALLADPPADGMLVTFITPGSPAEAAGLQAGDTIVTVRDAATPSPKEFYEALRPGGEDDDTRRIGIRRANGAEESIAAPHPFWGFEVCAVKAGACGWEELPDTEYEPDFSALADGAEIWLRNSLEEDRAGFERLVFRRTGDTIEVDTLFRLGGGSGEEAWDYRSRSVARHRLDRTLSLTKTTFREGLPEAEKLSGDVELGEDGVWRGTRTTPDGTEEALEHRPPTKHALNAYDVTVLPLTMPLREGARVTFCSATEGTGFVTGRARMECTGRETVDVDGEAVETWRFEWRHYGEYGTSEKFFVTHDRVLARVEWGPNYAGCWAVNVGREKVLEGVPDRVKIE